MSLSSVIFGNPLKTKNLEGERLSKVKALAIFSSDVLSSVAYATEEILLILGAGLAFSFSLPIALVIAGLLFVVSISYWQTIEAYPSGGGAFGVAHKNLGEFFGLIAASALLIDYTLTVAVSLSAGANAVSSAFPFFAKYKVSFCLVALAFITISNLRGARESASVLSVPTYLFIFLILSMVLKGCFTSVDQTEFLEISPNLSNAAIFLIVIRAFASGCSALTGIEAIASGVTAFKTPQYKNAQITLVVMAITLSSMFLGITYVADKFHILATASESVISQIARKIFGSGFLYYCVQIATACILLLAANTSFAGFPRLASVLAKEKYIPTRFAHLGDRLAFSNGIILLALVATFLIVMFNGDSHALIPMYSLGVFISFTLSQAGMVKHWIREKGENWHIKAGINAFGAIATCITLFIIVESKFIDGAFVVVFLIPVIFYMFMAIHLRYKATDIELDLKNGGLSKFLKPMTGVKPKVIVPISRIHKGTLSALYFATYISDDVTAVVIKINLEEVNRLKLTWKALNFPIPLVVLNSPYRSLVNPFLDFLKEQDERNPEAGKSIVVMPSFVPGKFWHNILHNQTAAIFKTALLYKKRASEQTRVIVEIPYQMRLDHQG